MAGSSDGYHEPYELLSPETRDVHRAVKSVMEELEAIDWYQQRADACQDDELRAILEHNKREEVEHALMGLEWLRRRVATFGEKAPSFLFTDGWIPDLEEAAEADAGEGAVGGSLGIGSLRVRQPDDAQGEAE